ncbi:MAG: exodeoxyribonuclease III [Bacteroidetes bacterium]|nr:exodeoxyribonuclease III [Bacteroidota bacterium]
MPNSVKLATWNVNSARARIERILDFLDRHSPDIVCLQEIKATEETFPYDQILEAGYESYIYGQPSYNGVALLTRESVEDVHSGLDTEARVIAGTVNQMRVINVYVPNGRKIGTPKHAYKLRWLDALSEFLDNEYEDYRDFILTGDLNVALHDIDVAHPDNWRDSVLCDPVAKKKIQAIMDKFSLRNIIREHNPGPGVYTWWDFRTRGFDWNDGVCIDYILATASLANSCTNAWVDVAERDRERPSDHAPVLSRFATGSQ